MKLNEIDTKDEIKNTLEFIKKAHASQSYNGQPYYHHPVAVMKRLPSSSSAEVKLAALLHDVIEDTEYTESDLLDLGYSKRTVDLVSKLSRPPGSTYLDWISDIKATGDKDLINIKVADNEENLSNIKNLPPEKQSIGKRYEKSLQILKK